MKILNYFKESLVGHSAVDNFFAGVFKVLLVSLMGGTLYGVAHNNIGLRPGSLGTMRGLSFTSSGSVTVISTVPYTINKSGSYAVSATLTGSITIDSSNVSLDLNNHSINGSSTHAITVTPGTSNVHIFNGFITSTQGDGIFINSTSSEQSYNICLTNLCINHCGGYAAIRLNYCNDSMITACQFSQNLRGISLNYCNAMLIKNCIVQTSSVLAYELLNSTFIAVNRCKAINIKGSGTIYGYYASAGNYNSFDSCYAEQIESSNGTAAGLQIGNEAAPMVRACIVNGVSGNSAYGISSSGTAQRAFISENIVQKVLGASGYGIFGNNKYDNNDVPNNVIIRNRVFNCSTNYSPDISYVSSSDDAGIIYNVSFY